MAITISTGLPVTLTLNDDGTLTVWVDLAEVCDDPTYLHIDGEEIEDDREIAITKHGFGSPEYLAVCARYDEALDKIGAAFEAKGTNMVEVTL